MGDNSIWYEDRAPSVKALQARIAELEAERDAARKEAAAWKAKAQEWRGVTLGYWVQEFRNDTRLSIYQWLRLERWMRNDGR